MSKMFKAPKMPEIPKPTPMVDEEALKRARLRTITQRRESGGRSSTILGSADKLGG